MFYFTFIHYIKTVDSLWMIVTTIVARQWCLISVRSSSFIEFRIFCCWFFSIHGFEINSERMLYQHSKTYWTVKKYWALNNTTKYTFYFPASLTDFFEWASQLWVVVNRASAPAVVTAAAGRAVWCGQTVHVQLVPLAPTALLSSNWGSPRLAQLVSSVNSALIPLQAASTRHCSSVQQHWRTDCTLRHRAARALWHCAALRLTRLS